MDGVSKGKSVHRAALDAGYSKRSAQHAGELLSATALREAFGRFIAPPEKIAQRINEGLDAVEERVIIVGRKGKEKVSIEHMVDYGERRQYAALAARLSSLDPGVKIEHSGEITNKVIVEMEEVAAQQSA